MNRLSTLLTGVALSGIALAAFAQSQVTIPNTDFASGSAYQLSPESLSATLQQ